MTFFCPACGLELEPEAFRCPACGCDLRARGADTYERKLILALGHPIREHRMMAIQILGKLRSTAAVGPLQTILQTESDYFALREVLTALANIESPESILALQSAKRHPSKLIRDLAARMLEQ